MLAAAIIATWLLKLKAVLLLIQAEDEVHAIALICFRFKFIACT